MVDDDEARRLSRRSFLMLTGAAGLTVVGARLLTTSAGRASVVAQSTPGSLTAYRNAMHVHSSFSEGTASLHSQLEEASRNAFDVLWPTDHDWRMSAWQAPTQFHFTGLTETVTGKKYTWRPTTTGSAAAVAGGVSKARVTSTDAARSKGSLKVEVRSSGKNAASRHFVLDGGAANQSNRTNLAGQTIVVDVYPELIGTSAWAEVVVTLSYRPAGGGRPTGSPQLVYQLGVMTPGRVAEGLRGIVFVRVPAGKFSTVTIDPVADATALWPDMVATDNALVELRLGATSLNKTTARAWFGNLRLQRTQVADDLPLQTQADMVRQYAALYPQLSIRRGVEVSGPSEHANWFGGDQHLIQHTSSMPTDVVAYAAALIHQGGGLASLNHPFGSSTGANVAQSKQDATRRTVAARFLARNLCGVDIVETGYRQRQGMSLETHLALYDTFLRSGYWVTATGVNDNHDGTAGVWSKEPNRFYSTTWAESPSEEDLLAALRSGRVFVGELGGFDGHLDLSVEGNPMGSVSIKPGTTTRELTVSATDLPAGSRIEVVRGGVDYGNNPDPDTSVVTTLPDTAFAGGTATVGIDTTTECFVRLNVVDSTGRRVAFSNPVVLLQQEPARPLPDWRRAPDSVVNPSATPSPTPSTTVEPSESPSPSDGDPSPSDEPSS